MRKIVLSIIRNNKSEVLLVRRKEIENGSGNSLLTWVFPGGTIEESESPAQAIIREVREETGYTIKPIKIIDEKNHEQFPVHITYIACKIDSDVKVIPPCDEDLSECLWVPIEKISDFITSNINSNVSKYLSKIE